MSERIRRGPGFVRSRGVTLVACAGVLAVAYSLCRRGINLTDEGYLLSQALDMLGGKLLYRDMDSFVTPGIWFLLAGLFKVVEPSVLASRALSFAGYAATMFFAFRIVAGVATRAAAWVAVAALLVASLWAFPAWTTVFYSPFAILFALAGLERLLAWRAGARARDLVICGLWLGLAVVFKQNYGAFALLGAAAALPVLRLEKGEAAGAAFRAAVADGLRMAAGAALAVLPVVAYFAAVGALGAIFDSLVVHPFVFMGRQDIPFPALSRLWAERPLQGMDILTYGSFSLNQAPSPFARGNPVFAWLHRVHFLQRLHLLLFWLPVVGAAVGAALALRPSGVRRSIDGGLACVLLVAGFVFLGVFPRADFNHLLNVYQPVILAAVVVAQRLLERVPKPATLPFRSAMALAGLFAAFYVLAAGTWYAHYLGALRERVGGPRGGVLVSSVDQALIDYQVQTIRELTAEGDAVLTVPALAMFNFLADRPMPGRYYNLYEHHIAHDEGLSVVESAEAQGVDLVVSDYGNFFSDRVGLRVYAPKLAEYLRTHFEPERDLAGDRYRYLRRREEPIPLRSSEDVVEGCEVPKGTPSYVREHLLFASLYQARDIWDPDARVETTCSLTVPDRAELVLSLGYRRPMAAEPGAAIRAEIRVVSSGRSEQLFSETISVEQQVGWSSPPPKEYRVDLTRFAGQQVELLFRAQFVGRARMGPFDIGGYALVWQDPRVEMHDGRALLVGIDGAAHRVIGPMIREGRLPHLASIARQGVAGSLHSRKPLVSPRLWTTIATGRRPAKHGILHWAREAEGGGLELFLGSDRVGPAIWNITSFNGLTTGVVNWLNSYPPEKIRGAVVSDFAIVGARESRQRMFAHKQAANSPIGEGVTHPAEWRAEVERLSQEAPLLPLANPFEDNEALPDWINQEIPFQSFRDDDLVTRIALAIDARIRPDLLMVYLPGIGKVSHNLWGALEPEDAYPDHIRFTPEEREASVAALERYYEYTDQLVGKLLERYGREDLVMVVSDHGFEGRLLATWLTGAHETDATVDGVLFARGWRIPPVKSLPLTQIADVTPTILAWLGMPPGSSMDGRKAAFLDVRAGVPTFRYDSIEIERVGDARAGVEDAIVDQLRGLGYVE